MITNISFLKRLKFLFTSDLNDLSTDIYHIFRKRKRIPEEIRNQVLNSDYGDCYYCQETFSKKELTVDHYIPLEITQEHKLENLVCACQACNTQKGNINPISTDKKEMNRWNNFLQFAKKKKQSWGSFVAKLNKLEELLSKNQLNTEDFLLQVNKLFLSYEKPKSFNFRRETNKILKKNHKELLNIISHNSTKSPVIDSSNIHLLISSQEKEVA